MPGATPRLGLSVPAEFDEPYFASAQGFELGVDAGIYANAENSQLIFESTGIVGWNATMASPTTGVLFWSENINITAFSTTFQAQIAGPASVQLQDGDVLFFQMPRLMQQTTPVSLYKSNTIFLQGTYLPDLRLFCARQGTTLYFYNNLSLKDGDTGYLWGGGLNNTSIFPAHEHDAPIIIQPPTTGISTLTIGVTSPALQEADVYRNGQLLTNGIDYTLNPVTGVITLTVPTQSNHEVFQILVTVLDTTHTTSTHEHLPPLVVTPLPSSTVLDALVFAPTLQAVDLYRNGMLQASPNDYTLDISTGLITLVTPTVTNEVFQMLRIINI